MFESFLGSLRGFFSKKPLKNNTLKNNTLKNNKGPPLREARMLFVRNQRSDPFSSLFFATKANPRTATSASTA